MPKYFLDLELGAQCIVDVIGCYAVDDTTVLQVLMEVLSELGESVAPASEDGTRRIISISDQAGRLVAKIPL